MLEKGFHDVPPGCVATTVTYLEMRSKPTLRDVAPPHGITLERIESPTTEWYYDLYRRVGAQDWMWFSRLVIPETDLSAILASPSVEIYAIQKNGQAEGLLELDFRVPGECELSYFGLTDPVIGQGVGRFMMNGAITHAWDKPITRFHVHTCTLDHPSALAFYRRSGFTAVRQQVEIADDPRLIGAIPRDAASRIPIIE